MATGSSGPACGRRAPVSRALVPLAAGGALLAAGIPLGMPWLVLATPVVPMALEMRRRLALARPSATAGEVDTDLRLPLAAIRERAVGVAVAAHDANRAYEPLPEAAVALVVSLERLVSAASGAGAAGEERPEVLSALSGGIALLEAAEDEVRSGAAGEPDLCVRITRAERAAAGLAAGLA